MQTLPIRLNPGDDLRAAIEAAVRGADCHAAFVISGIGSLSTAGLRFAGADQPRRFHGDIEILSLAGSIAVDGAHSSSHLHMALSTASGEVFGGHVMSGCIVRTTAEILLALLPEWAFSRVPDAATGYLELEVAKRDFKLGGGNPDAI
jgi:predicted DNA-binding protein with PD1-like motif